MNRYFQKEHMGWQKSIQEKALHQLVIKERRIKTMSYHYIPIKIAKIQNIEPSNAGENRKQKEELLFINSKNAKMVHLVWKVVCQF